MSHVIMKGPTIAPQHALSVFQSTRLAELFEIYWITFLPKVADMAMIFDIETDGLKLDRISRVWCLCCIDEETDQVHRFGPSQILEGIELLESADRLIGHNIGQFDLPVLRHLFGFDPDAEIVDTLVLSRLIFNGLSDEADRHGRHSLDAWGKRLGCHKGEWTEFSKWAPEMLDYCEQDCRVTYRMLEHFRRQRGFSNAARLEIGYDAFLRRVERHGFTLDVQGAKQLQTDLQAEQERLLGILDESFPPEIETTSRPSFYSYEPVNGHLFDFTVPQCRTKSDLERWRKSQKIKPREVRLIEGPPITRTKRFNPCSSSQVISGLRSIGWDPQKENESGSINTGEAELLRAGIPEAERIAEYRAFSKLESFCKQWIKYERGGKLHPSFLGNRAASGRSSCRAPNIQQIPKKKDRKGRMPALASYGDVCRALFRPQAGYVLVGADLSNIEGRLLAHRLFPYDGGEYWDRVLKSKDIHAENAKQIGISREHAKAVLYGSMYGQGPTSLAADLEISKDEARNLIDALTTGLAGFSELKRDLLKEWRRNRRIKLSDGRRIQVTREHKVLNYSIQGDAAILMKRWAILAEKRLQDTSCRILGVIHDEIQCECSPEDSTLVQSTLCRSATDAGEQLGFNVTIEAEAKEGTSWSVTH